MESGRPPAGTFATQTMLIVVDDPSLPWTSLRLSVPPMVGKEGRQRRLSRRAPMAGRSI
jgi:hypothetical protein